MVSDESGYVICAIQQEIINNEIIVIMRQNDIKINAVYKIIGKMRYNNYNI